MKVALVQLEVRERSKNINVVRGLMLTRQAAQNNDLVVLPEVWTTGYSLGHLQEEAEEPDGKVIQELCTIAKENCCHIVAGSVPMRHEGRIYNTSVAIDKTGHIVNCYSKVHLFGLFHEEDFFAAGQNFRTFALDDICCGSTICYDLRFPELYRHLALQGAQLVFCPAEWPTARGNAWRLLAQARAIEDQVFLLATNCAGTFKGAPFYGHSMIIAPSGKILAEAGEQEEVISWDIDLDEVAKVRAKINVLNDVRKELIH